MRSALRRGLFFSLLLALTLPLASCDLFGSDDSSPDWVGTWELIDDDNSYVSLSQEVVRFVSNPVGDNSCSSESEEFVDVDGNIVTITDDVGEEDSARLEVSGDVLTIDDLDEGENEYRKVDGNSRDLDALLDLAGCE